VIKYEPLGVEIVPFTLTIEPTRPDVGLTVCMLVGCAASTDTKAMQNNTEVNNTEITSVDVFLFNQTFSLT
jgi:hypothetical protein